MIQTSDLLSFAGIEPLTLPAIPLSQHLAEKVHAYTRRYGSSELPSTRPKDLIDILLIEGSATIEAAALRHALETTFSERALQPLPASLPVPPTAWTTPYRRLAETVDIEPNLATAFARAAVFLDPILAAKASGQWDTERQEWMPPTT